LNKKTLFLLLIAVALGAFYRSFLLSSPLFYASDELYHYSVARNAVENGFIVQDRFILSGYPNGTLVTEPKGLYYIAVIPYFFLRNFVSLMDIMRLLPLIFGVSYVVLIFLIAREVFDEKIAIISSFLISASVANIQRTAALIYRGDGFMPFFFLISIYFLILFFKKNKKIYSIASGIFLSLSSLVWNGATFCYLTYSLALIFIAIFFFLKGEKEKFKNNFFNVLAILVSFLLYNSYKFLSLIYEQPFMHNFPLILLSIFFLFLFLYFFINISLKKKVALIFFVFVFSTFVIIKFFREEIENVITGYGLAKAISPLAITIVELQTPSIRNFITIFDVFLPFMFIGVLIELFKVSKMEIKENELLLLTFFLTSFYLATQSIRFFSLLSYTFSIFSAFGFVAIFSIFDKVKVSERIKKNVFYASLSVLLFLYFFDAYPLLQGGNIEYNKYWQEAMDWLKRNSQPNSGVIIWWNEGTMVELLAHRAAYIDSVGAQNEERITLFSKLMLSDRINVTFFQNFKNNNAPVFLVTSPLWMWQIRNWLIMTNKTTSNYGFAILSSATPISKNTFLLTSDDKRWNVFFNTTDAWVFNGSKKLFIPFVETNFSRSYYKEFDAPYTLILIFNSSSSSPSSSSNILIGGFLITKELANTAYIKLQFYCDSLGCFYPFKQIYSNYQVKIFSVDPSIFS
jgi:asparagine N-glycosylation enzyme membrane subunit Stt3